MTGKHRARPVTETSDYVAMLTRLLNAWGDRVAADPAALVHLRDLERTLSEATSRGIFEANRRPGGYNMSEIARMMGVTRQGIAKRVALGEVIYAAAQVRASAAAPLVRLADIRRARAAGLASAEVTDITGSERERRAG